MSPIQLSEKLRSSMNGRSDPTMINYGINTVVDLLYFLLSADIRVFRLHVATYVTCVRDTYVGYVSSDGCSLLCSTFYASSAAAGTS